MGASDSLRALEQAEHVLAVATRERDQLHLRIAHLEQLVADLRASIEADVKSASTARPVSTKPQWPAGFSDIVVQALGVAQRMRDNPESQRVVDQCLRAAQEFHDAHASPRHRRPSMSRATSPACRP